MNPIGACIFVKLYHILLIVCHLNKNKNKERTTSVLDPLLFFSFFLCFFTNNFINTNLNIISKQLTKIKKTNPKTIVNPADTTKPTDLRLKNLVFNTISNHHNKPNTTPN